jgi:calcyclin binding protein
LNGKSYRLIKDNLDKDIVPDKSKFIVKKNKVIVKLQKVKGEYSYEHWANLTSKKGRDNTGASAKKDPSASIMDMMKDMCVPYDPFPCPLTLSFSL